MTPRPPMTAPELEQYATRGLLDQMLQLRTFPDPSVLILAASNESPVDAVAAAWKGAIDASLDLIVPAMKQLAMLPGETNHNANCINKQGVSSIIGRIPFTRNEKGWSL